MDRYLDILHRQISRLNAGEMPIDPVKDAVGLPISFDDWCNETISVHGQDKCPSYISQLIVSSVHDDSTVGDIVSTVRGRFRQRDVRYQNLDDGDVTTAVKDLALALRHNKSLPEKVQIGQSLYDTKSFLAKYEDSASTMPTNLIQTLQIAGVGIQIRHWSVGSLIGLIRHAAATLA